AATTAASMVASMASGVADDAGVADAAHGRRVAPVVSMALPAFRPTSSAAIESPLVRSRADLGTGRMRERRQVRRGATVRVPLTITNGTNRAQRGLMLRSSDLMSSQADRIPSDAVSFSPPRLDLPPRGRTVVTAAIDVPSGARPGSYTARVYAPNHEGVETILTFSVR
ncbi:MAG: hypothetical protein ACRD2W_07620, partial [Acidimicrobiales bacterium]